MGFDTIEINLVLVKKHVDEKKFGQKKVFVEKDIWSKKIFGRKKCLVEKKFWLKKMFG